MSGFFVLVQFFNNQKKYYLGKPADAFSVMRNLGLGITNDNVRKIGIGE